VVLSKRERYIGLICGAVVVLLIVNQIILSPLEEKRDKLDDDIAAAMAANEAGMTAIKKSKYLAPRWADMNRSGLLRSESATNSQIYNAISSWARDAQLSPPPAMKSDRTEKEKQDFYKVTIRGTANGGIEQLSKFLWHVQTASFPVRVTDLTLTSRKGGTDDLSMTLGLATMYLNQADAPGASSGGGNNNIASSPRSGGNTGGNTGRGSAGGTGTGNSNSGNNNSGNNSRRNRGG